MNVCLVKRVFVIEWLLWYPFFLCFRYGTIYVASIDKKVIITSEAENAKLAAGNKKKAQLLKEYISWFESGKVSFGTGWTLAKRGSKGMSIQHRNASHGTMFKDPVFCDIGVSIHSTQVLCSHLLISMCYRCVIRVLMASLCCYLAFNFVKWLSQIFFFLRISSQVTDRIGICLFVVL